MAEKETAPAHRVTAGCNYPDPKRKGKEIRLEAGDRLPEDCPSRVLRALQRRGVLEEV